MVHMASSQRLHRDEDEDERVNATGCIRLCYPNFTIFIVLGHKNTLVISFPINRTQGLMERIKHSAIPLPPLSYSSFLRDVGVLDGVREERRGSERSLQSSKEWEDVMVVFAPCRLLICINIAVCLG
jgi:hypothetical protein